MTQGNLDQAIKEIDVFGEKNWLMNLGPEKAMIIKSYCGFKDIKNILEIGGYCGYSALTFASLMPEATIHTIEISPEYGSIAGQIAKIAGVSNRIHIHTGTVTTL